MWYQSLGLVGSAGTSTPTLVDYGDLNMINILEFGSKSLTDNSSLFQTAINSGSHIFVPEGVWPIAAPVTYTNRLLLTGECGFVTGGGKHTTIAGSAALGYAPMFHRAGHYLRYSENGTNPHQWVSTSGSAASVPVDTVVQLQDLRFTSVSDNNSCIQLFGCKQAQVKYCQIEPSFRGVEAIRCDSVQFLQLGYGRLANPSWVADVNRLRNSWAMMSDGNTLFDQCNCQGGLLGFQVFGQGNQISGGRFEVLHVAGIWGGKSPDPSTLNQVATVTASEMYTSTFESNRRSLIFTMGDACEVRCFEILGSNCFNDLGTGSGNLQRFGMMLNSIAASSSIRNGTIANAATQVGGIVNASEVPYLPSNFPTVAGVGYEGP